MRATLIARLRGGQYQHGEEGDGKSGGGFHGAMHESKHDAMFESWQSTACVSSRVHAERKLQHRLEFSDV